MPVCNEHSDKDTKKSNQIEADIPCDEKSQNPIISFAGNEVNFTFKVRREVFLKIATAAIEHFKRKDEDSLPGNTSGTDEASSSNPVDNNSDSISSAVDANSLVDANKDGGSQENHDGETVEELAYETSSVENRSCAEVSIDNGLESSDVFSEKGTSQIENDASNGLHMDSILDEKIESDLNESNLYDAPESECPELENTWPEMHPFKTGETIQTTELKSLAIRGVLTKYFKLELADLAIVIKVSGDSNDFNVDAKKYELKTSSDADLQDNMSDQLNNSTEQEMHIIAPEDSALKSSESDEKINLSTLEDECSEQCAQEKIMGQSLSKEVSKSGCVTSNVLEISRSPELESTMKDDSYKQYDVMDELVEDETKSEEAENSLLDCSTASEMKSDETNCVDASTIITNLDNSLTVHNSESSRHQIEDDVVDESVPNSRSSSCQVDVKEIESEALEKSLGKIEERLLDELKILPISGEQLSSIEDKLIEEALNISESVNQMTKDLKTESEDKISEKSREEKSPYDEISFQMRLPVSAIIQNEPIAHNECSVDVQSEKEEKRTERNFNNSVTPVDKCPLKDVAVEEKALEKSPMSYKINELNSYSFESTQTVSGKMATEVGTDEEPINENSKVFPEVLESNTPETTITGNLSKEELKRKALESKSKTIEERECCETAFVSSLKSTLNESINVEKNGSSSPTGDSDNISITIGEDIVGESKNIALNELNESPENDFLKSHSIAIKTSENVESAARGISEMKISESAPQTVGETELVSPKVHFQKEAIVENESPKVSILSNKKNDSFSKVEEASSEKSPESVESHHSTSSIIGGSKIKLSFDDDNEYEIIAETKPIKCPEIEVSSIADVCLEDVEECENEISGCELPDICQTNDEYKLAVSPSQMSEKEYENSTDAVTKSDVYESDENLSVASESEDNKSREKTPSDIDEADSAPTRVRTRKAVGSKYGTKLSADAIPENDVKNTRSASLNSKLVASASKFSGKVSPIMRSLRSKSLDKTIDSGKKSENVESTKKRGSKLEISKNDVKVVARSSPRKVAKKNSSNSETKVVGNLSDVGNSRQKSLNVSMPHTNTGRTRRAKE